jgi:phage-related protein
MRTLTAAVLAEINARVNRSCWLLELYFSTVLRLCNWPVALTYDGNDYSPFDLQVHSYAISTNGQVSASLELGNVDNVIGFYVLTEGLSNINVNLYQAYIDTDDEVIADPELLAAGRTNGGSLNAKSVQINIRENQNVRLNVLPHRFMTPDTGFHHLPPKGQIIEWGGERYELKDR